MKKPFDPLSAFIRITKSLLLTCLLSASLTGCAAAPLIRDPFADLDTARSSPSLRELTVGVVLSDNTMETLKFAEQINSGPRDAYLKIPGMNQKIADYKQFLKKTFKTVVEINKNDEPKGMPVDVVAVLDMHFDEWGGVGGSSKTEDPEVVISMRTIFLTPARAPIDTAYGKGITDDFGDFGPQLKWQKYIEEAMYRAANEMGRKILASAPLAGYARANAGRSDSLARAPSAPAVRSDVDEPPAGKAGPNRNSYAIVIGIEQYRQKLPRADFAAHDARIVTDYLTKMLGFPEGNVVTLLNDRALKSDLEKYFEKWLGNNVEAGGTVFVYYSGHGAPDLKSGSAYLVPYDGDPAFIDQTGYSLKRMYEALAKLPAKKIIVALDSCFSGAGGRSVVAKGARPLVMHLADALPLPRNMVVMSAARGDQASSTYDEKGHGLFTYFMLKGMKTRDVTGRDGTLEVEDLFGYIKPQVEQIARKQYNNEQSPQLMRPKENQEGEP